jgi:hypothetical protein
MVSTTMRISAKSAKAGKVSFSQANGLIVKTQLEAEYIHLVGGKDTFHNEFEDICLETAADKKAVEHVILPIDLGENFLIPIAGYIAGICRIQYHVGSSMDKHHVVACIGSQR